MKRETVPVAEVAAKCDKRILSPWPATLVEDGTTYIVLECGSEYRVPSEPGACLGLVSHLAEKRKVNKWAIQRILQTIADANGWRLF